MKTLNKDAAAVKYNRSDPTPVVREIKHVKPMVKPTTADVKVALDEEDYDQVDEWKMADFPRAYQRPPPPLPVNSGAQSDTKTYIKPSEVNQRPTAHVVPSNSHLGVKTKQFKDLNNVELVQRLKLCGLDEFASFCEKENLNGAFFTNISKETLSNEMNLTGVPLYKVIQMRDTNWFPT